MQARERHTTAGRPALARPARARPHGVRVPAGGRPLPVFQRAHLLAPGECVAARDAVVRPGTGVEMHLHDFYEVALIVSGRGQHLHGTAIEGLLPGDVLLINPSIPHGFAVPGPEALVVRNVLFTEAAVGDALGSPEVAASVGMFFRVGGGSGVPRLRPDGDEAADRGDADGPLGLSARMAAEYAARLPGYQALLQGYLRVLLVSVWRAFGAREGQGRSDDPGWLRLVPALQRMYQASGAGLPLPDLAAGAGWSPTHFSRVFRRATGQSVQRFLRRLRVQHAAALLVTTAEPLEAVAARAGYSDGRALRRAFCACFQATPEQYRRMAVG